MSKSFREMLLEQEEEEAKTEYQKIIKLESLNPSELWEITDENFYQWINKHYYPKLLDKFRTSLDRFDVWQRIWNLDDDQILRLGVTSCIESTGDSKNIYKYIIESESYQGIDKFVSKTNLDGKIKPGGPYFTYKYKKLDSFVPYFDWIKFQANVSSETIRNENLIQFTGGSHIDTDLIDHTILGGFKLLKMGGLEPLLNKFGILHTKHIEFGNFARLRFSGKIATQNKVLSISNSIINDLTLLDCELFQVTFYKCKMRDLYFDGAKINSWNFIDCKVQGEIINSELSNVEIVGGSFDVIFRDTKLFNVKGHHHKTKLGFESAYLALKQAYKNQGEDAQEQMYYLKEKEYKRQSILLQFRINFKNLNSEIREHKFSQRLLFRYINSHFENLRWFWSYFLKSINYHYWGYGLKPRKVISSSVFIMASFSLFYFLQMTNYSFNAMNLFDAFESLKISISSFSTLGFFSDKVNEVSDSLVIFESIIGGLSIGAFIASASNMKF